MAPKVVSFYDYATMCAELLWHFNHVISSGLARRVHTTRSAESSGSRRYCNLIGLLCFRFDSAVIEQNLQHVFILLIYSVG